VLICRRRGRIVDTMRYFYRFLPHFRRLFTAWNKNVRTGHGRWNVLYSPRFLVAITAGCYSSTDSNRTHKDIPLSRDTTQPTFTEEGEWETMVQAEDLMVYRRLLSGSSHRNIYEYKCVGSYSDISPNQFLYAQMDPKFRKSWDHSVLEFSIVSSESDSEVVRWVTKYPFPLYAREYIFSRRCMVNDREQEITVISQAVPSENYPISKKLFRVNTYQSRMVVKAHTKFDQKGMDYVLVYRDDPEAAIPSSLYNWFVLSGGPDFLKRVHDAALSLGDF